VRFQSLTLDELHLEDERSFRHVAIYDELKQALRRDGYRFRVPPRGSRVSWDRVLFLNLTFWDASEQGDVLLDDHLDADVVAHVAWHHLTQKALSGAGISAGGLFLGESIASAFDLYLVGRLLGHSPDARFLETQVPSMAEAAEAAGLSEDGFEALLGEISADPDRAFEDLRELLFDAATTLVDCSSVSLAAEALARFDAHRFAPLLHHYALSNWILYARAHAPRSAPTIEPAVRAIDEALRAAPSAVDWLEAAWVLAAPGGAAGAG
jgi:DNA-binding transcriptional regulator YdaS (Cro superfamily)